MSVRIDKQDAVLTVIHSRPQARNAMDPAIAKDFFEAFNQFDEDPNTLLVVFW